MVRARFCLCVLATVGLWACSAEKEDAPSKGEETGPPRAEPPKAPVPIPAGDHVRVREGAALLLEPKADGKTVAVVPTETDSTSPSRQVKDRKSPKPGVTMEVLATETSYVRVRSLAGVTDMSLCGMQPQAFEQVQVEAWVHRSDLLSVLRRSVENQHEDGTGVKLEPGVAVGPAGPHGLRVADVEVGVLARVEAPAIGDHWRPVDGPEFTGMKFLGSNAGTYRGGVMLANAPEMVETAREEKDDGVVLSTVSSACGTFRLIVEEGTRQKSGLYAMKGPKDAVPQVARNFDPEIAAENAGILGALREKEGGHFLASPYGGAFVTGTDDEDVWGGLTGTEVGEAYGVGGLGLVGSGRCVPTPAKAAVAESAKVTWEGTEVPAGTVLIATRLPKGAAAESGPACFVVPGLKGTEGDDVRVCATREKVSVVPGQDCEGPPLGLGSLPDDGSKPGGKVRQAKAKVSGALDKDIIRRIVRAHINEVRTCYGKGLAKRPDLQGKVEINFVITGRGKVGSSVVQSTTLKDRSVANCIAKAVKKWKFPKPKGGGNVLVTYPFVLSPE